MSLSEQVLLRNMTNMGITYAMYDKKHDRFLDPDSDMFSDPKYVEQYCVVQSPDIFLKSKKGTCYETAWYIYNIFKKERQDPIFVFLEFDNMTTHTLTLYKHKFSRLWYWMEYSWEKLRGIHGGYMNIDFLYDYIERTCNKQGLKINMFNKNVDMSVFDNKLYVSIPEWNKQMKA